MARKLIPLSVALTGALIVAAPASAADPVTCDGLQTALDNAPAGSTVTLKQGERCTDSYTLPSQQITLEGGGTGATFDGGDEVRSLSGTNVEDTVIRNLRFVRGWAGNDGGGAILVQGFSPITIENSVFEDSHADGDGGAVLVTPQSCCQQTLSRTNLGDAIPPVVTIARSTFGGENGGSSASYGGAVAVYGFQLDVADSKFLGNRAEFGGGGLFALNRFDPITLRGNEFTDNDSGDSGGGAKIASCDTLTVADNVFAENTVVPDDGSQVEGAGLWVDGCSFAERAVHATALRGKSGDATLEQTGNTFRANVLESGSENVGEGAGEWVNSVSLTSTDDTFHANQIVGNGIGYGGGLRYEDGEGAVLRNFVATANTLRSGYGGGVSFDADGASLKVVHATIAENAIGEGEGSGIEGGDDQSLFLDNSIVHGNTGGSSEIGGFRPTQVDGRAATGAAVESGDVTVSSSLLCDGTAAWPGDGNLCADPKLANAADGDVHQTAASPTLEKASATLTDGLDKDYEGDGRVLDYDRTGGAQPDMGADEAPAPPVKEEATPTPTAATPQPAPAAGVVLGTQARSCSSKRSFKIKLRNRGQKVVKATVIVNGKKVKVLRGTRLTSRVNLRGLPKGRFTVKIKLQLANGKVISGTRRYRTCTPGVPSGPPKV